MRGDWLCQEETERDRHPAVKEEEEVVARLLLVLGGNVFARNAVTK